MKETISQKKERVLKIIDIFDIIYKGADCTLDYENPLQLLIATQLAAQCTDARVNLVTPALFKKYPDTESYAEADITELEEIIRSCGFYKNKAKNIIGTGKKLMADFGGEVPSTLDELLTLPGVGRKTANLVLGDVFGTPGIVVDTHATRISNLLGLTKSKDPYKIELDLMKVVPKEKWSSFCHQLVTHGREYCIARRPRCLECPINEYCKNKKDEE